MLDHASKSGSCWWRCEFWFMHQCVLHDRIWTLSNQVISVGINKHLSNGVNSEMLGTFISGTLICWYYTCWRRGWSLLTLVFVATAFHPMNTLWTHCGLVTSYGSGIGLLPGGTKPLPEPMLTDYQLSPVTIILGQFHERCLNHQSLKSVWKLHV